MSQQELDQLVSGATGESPRTVRRLGFSSADPLDVTFDPELSMAAKFVDWDELDVERHTRLAVH